MGRMEMRAVALGVGLFVGGGLAFAQGSAPEERPEREQHQRERHQREGREGHRGRAQMCPGGCPLCEAHREATSSLNQGATVTMEEQPDGAILRFEAPAGDPAAIDAARDAAEAYALALQSPETGQGCPCPHGQEDSVPEEEPLFP